MGDRPTVAVVGADAAAVADAAEAAGGRPAVGVAADAVDGADYALAVGETALLAVARAAPSAPVLPVAAGRGVRSVPRADLESAVAALRAGEYDVRPHPVCDVRVGDRTRTRVLLDCMLVTAEPAQISEYAVRTGADGELVSRFRADGVVVATPAGSGGYANRVGAPVVAPETGVVVAAPVAPFATDADHWVLPAGEVRVSVERDVAPVDLVADDRVAGRVTPEDPVRLTTGGRLDVAVVDASEPPFERV